MSGPGAGWKFGVPFTTKLGSATVTPSAADVTTTAELVRPPDGNYQIWLHGWAVAGTPSITMRVDAIQGNDLTVTGLPPGPVPANTPVTLHVAFAKPMTAGQDYFGELPLGPRSAPTAFTVPVTVRRR